jgi:hypothetical protein
MFLNIAGRAPYSRPWQNGRLAGRRGWALVFGPLFAAVILLFPPLFRRCYPADI